MTVDLLSFDSKYSNLILIKLFIFRIIFKGNPGKFVCVFFGYTKDLCGKLPLIDKLPNECTSFIIDGYKLDRVSICDNNTLSEIIIGSYDGKYLHFFFIVLNNFYVYIHT